MRRISAILSARSASGSPKRTAQAAMMEFSYLLEQGAIHRNPTDEALHN